MRLVVLKNSMGLVSTAETFASTILLLRNLTLPHPASIWVPRDRFVSLFTQWIFVVILSSYPAGDDSYGRGRYDDRRGGYGDRRHDDRRDYYGSSSSRYDDRDSSYRQVGFYSATGRPLINLLCFYKFLQKKNRDSYSSRRTGDPYEGRSRRDDYGYDKYDKHDKYADYDYDKRR